ncbi:MAG: hypothetical protein ACYS7Y_20150 [Planctomycetota bacterium]|jgi:hypothetical protein
MNDHADGIYEIHPFNLEALRDKLATMQRRARKLKTEPITIEECGTKVVTVSKTMPGGKIVKFDEERILIRVHGETPKLAGWSLVAKIEWLGEERLVSCVPGESCPEKYRTGDFTCEHCNTSRQRKEVFVLRHENGEHKQVGRQCIKDFLGGLSPEQLLAEAEYIFRAESECGECSDERMGGGWTPETINIDEYLTGVAICIRRLGWLSKSKCRLDETSTSTDAWNLIKPDIRNDRDRVEYNKWVEKCNLQYQDRDKAQAEEALEWAKSQPVEGVSDYLYNLGVACRAGYVTRRSSGLVASAIFAHTRHLEREEELNQRRQEDAKKSREWVGEIKKRQVFEKLTVTKMRYIEGDWGTSTLVMFEDEPGNIIKWFCSKELDDLERGDVVTIKATPKKHDEYNGVKQTQVNRAVIMEKHEEVAA